MTERAGHADAATAWRASAPIWIRVLWKMPWSVQEKFWHAFGGVLGWLCGFVGHRWDQGPWSGIWSCERWGCDYWLLDDLAPPFRWQVI